MVREIMGSKALWRWAQFNYYTISENKALFIQKERFYGLLVPIFSNLLIDTKFGFKLMNNALKQEAEEKATHI